MISNDKTCGFPLASINKVTSNLENRSINYILIDKAHNYEEIEKMNYKKKNNYDIIKNKSLNYIDKIERINKIKAYLLKDDSKLKDIENLLYER